MPTLSSRPLYLQVCDEMAERIATSVWKPGGAIANESDLAREFGVSSGTVRKALQLLEEKRLITRRQGRGSFVSDQTSGDLADRFTKIRRADGASIASNIKSAEVEEAEATEEERARLWLEAGDPVVRFRRVLLENDVPFMIEKSSIPAKLFAAVREKSDVGDPIVVLAHKCGVLLGDANERIVTGVATADVAEALRIAVGAPVVVLDRVIAGFDGRPVEWRMGWCILSGRYYEARIGA